MNRTALESEGSAALISLNLSGDESDWQGRIASPSEWLLSAVASLHNQGLESVTIEAQVSDAANDGLSEAACQMVRGVAGSAALEFSETRTRVNSVIYNGHTLEKDREVTRGYLQSVDDAGFTTGATIRLDSAPIPRNGESPQGVVLVTGGAGGLGRAAVERLIGDGREVIISDLPGDTLEQATAELGVVGIPANLSTPEGIAALIEHEGIARVSDLLIHHGVGASSRLDENYDPVSAKRSVDINGTSVWATYEAFEPLLAQHHTSTVVMLSSVAGLNAEPGNAAYGAAKFAVVGFVNGNVERARQHGIRLNALCPGPIDTPLMRSIFAGFARDLGITAEEFTAQRLGSIPLQMAGAPHHIGATAALFTSLEATGIVLAPTGGEVLT